MITSCAYQILFLFVLDNYKENENLKIVLFLLLSGLPRVDDHIRHTAHGSPCTQHPRTHTGYLRVPCTHIQVHCISILSNEMAECVAIYERPKQALSVSLA